MGDNSTSRNVIIGVVVVVLILVILFASDLLGFQSEGDFEPPQVSIQGGELPEADLEAADIDIGTTTTTTEVPTLEVDTETVTTETPTVEVDPVE